MQNTSRYRIIILFIVVVFVASCGVQKSKKDLPKLENYTLNTTPRQKVNDSLFFKENSSLRKNGHGQWELVASGNPLDLGNTIGELSKELIVNQQDIFFSKVEELVPSKFKQVILRNFLTWYNRKMYLFVNEEYKAEIYGMSKYTSDKYSFIKNKYLRSLYLNGAHDIGHAFQDLALVGCSSFAVWGNKSQDGNLLVARNFDFYVGEEFAKEKVISFIAPEKGYKFMSVSWAGMIGVMSGMNNQGLTVTINAGKSDIPVVAKTPVSLVAREILQYASNIEEAIEIAKNKQVFVSESIMVGSAADNSAVLIEISPEKFGVFKVENTSQLVCTNHFQSKAYADDSKNMKQKKESHSTYRYQRMEELLSKENTITPQKAVDILRNKDGLHDKKIGYGNEKALNQLLAHHGIVFQPQNKMVWVSANPYQLGAFVAFQLDSVFANASQKITSLSLSNKLIPKDNFLQTKAYQNYKLYLSKRKQLEKKFKARKEIRLDELNNFKALNPDSWEVYNFVGKYYFEQKYYTAAKKEFEMALTKEVTTIPDKLEIENYINRINKKLK